MNPGYDFQKARVFTLEPGIIVIEVKNHSQLEVQDVLEYKKAAAQLSGGKPYVIFVDSSQFSSLSKEGREASATIEFSDCILAKGYLINSLPQKLIANFYLKINRPKIETRLFVDKKAVLEWLRKKIMEHNLK